MKVKDLNIFDEFETVTEKTTVLDASKLMKDKKLPDLVLIDNYSQPIGIVSSEDIVINVMALEKNPRDVEVSSIARKVKVFSVETTHDVIFKYMVESNTELVPIVNDDGKLMGVCTIGDVAFEEEN